MSKTNQVRIEVTGRLRGDGRTTDSATTVRPIRPLPDFVQTGSAAAAASARHTPHDARTTPFILHYRGQHQDCSRSDSKGAPRMFHWGRDRRTESGVGSLMSGSNSLYTSWVVWESAVSSPSGVGGGTLTAQRFSTIFSTRDGLS